MSYGPRPAPGFPYGYAQPYAPPYPRYPVSPLAIQQMRVAGIVGQGPAPAPVRPPVAMPPAAPPMPAAPPVAMPPIAMPPNPAPAPMVVVPPAAPVTIDVAQQEPPGVAATWFKSLPSMLLFGVTTGAAFAIGSGLVERYVFNRSRG